MDNNKENLAVLNMFDEGYLSCTEIFCDNLDNSSSKSVPAAVQPNNNNNNAQHELHNLGKSLPKLLQVKAQVDRTLVADDRVLANMIRHETRYLPSNPDYFRYVQPEIRPHMRKIVSDWMLEVCQELACQPEVFCLAMNLMDRFLARCRISKSQLQLLGAVCLFLSSKFKETAPIPSEKLVMYTDFSVSLEEIREWELVVLHKLKWDLCSSTALDYLNLPGRPPGLLEGRGLRPGGLLHGHDSDPARLPYNNHHRHPCQVHVNAVNRVIQWRADVDSGHALAAGHAAQSDSSRGGRRVRFILRSPVLGPGQVLLMVCGHSKRHVVVNHDRFRAHARSIKDAQNLD